MIILAQNTENQLQEEFSYESVLYDFSHDLLCLIEISNREQDRNEESHNSESDNQGNHISRKEYADEKSKEHRQCYDSKKLYYEEEVFVHRIYYRGI
jgi:hypothetical protein